MRGGSLLIIFEGDEIGLNRVLENEKEVRRVEFELINGKGKGKGKGKEKESDVMSGENMREKLIEDQRAEAEEEEGSETDSIETSDSQGVALPHTLLSLQLLLLQ